MTVPSSIPLPYICPNIFLRFIALVELPIIVLFPTTVPLTFSSIAHALFNPQAATLTLTPAFNPPVEICIVSSTPSGKNVIVADLCPPSRNTSRILLSITPCNIHVPSALMILFVDTLSVKNGLSNPRIPPLLMKNGVSPPKKNPPRTDSPVTDDRNVKFAVPVTFAVGMEVMLTSK